MLLKGIVQQDLSGVKRGINPYASFNIEPLIFCKNFVISRERAL
jgi:hypothetical protein